MRHLLDPRTFVRKARQAQTIDVVGTASPHEVHPSDARGRHHGNHQGQGHQGTGPLSRLHAAPGGARREPLEAARPASPGVWSACCSRTGTSPAIASRTSKKAFHGVAEGHRGPRPRPRGGKRGKRGAARAKLPRAEPERSPPPERQDETRSQEPPSTTRGVPRTTPRGAGCRRDERVNTCYRLSLPGGRNATSNIAILF